VQLCGLQLWWHGQALLLRVVGLAAYPPSLAEQHLQWGGGGYVVIRMLMHTVSEAKILQTREPDTSGYATFKEFFRYLA
jgi:hypothetical protein